MKIFSRDNKKSYECKKEILKRRESKTEFQFIALQKNTVHS